LLLLPPLEKSLIGKILHLEAYLLIQATEIACSTYMKESSQKVIGFVKVVKLEIS
jgi:hypothetical protein